MAGLRRSCFAIVVLAVLIDVGVGKAAALRLVAVGKNGELLNPPTSSLVATAGDIIEAEWRLQPLQCSLEGFFIFLDVRLDGASGDVGQIMPLGWNLPALALDCETHDECPDRFPLCVGECAGVDHDPREGVWFDCANLLIPFCQFGCGARGLTHAEWFAVPKCVEAPLWPHSQGYAGSLTLLVSEHACGTFEIGNAIVDLVCDPPDFSETLIVPLLIHVEAGDNVHTVCELDMNGDAKLDLKDVATFLRCFGAEGEASLLCPAADVDDNQSINLVDFRSLAKYLSGPQ